MMTEDRQTEEKKREDEKERCGERTAIAVE